MIALVERPMSFATVAAPMVEQSIRLTAAFEKTYIWADKSTFASSFDDYCRTNGYLETACEKYGIKPAIHTHLGSLVETPYQLEKFLDRCPQTGLILDTGHMAVAGGDILDMLERYFYRICAVHIKNRYQNSPDNIRDGYF